MDLLLYFCTRNKLTRYNRCRISRNWCKGLYRNKVATYDRMLYMPWLRFYNSDALLLAVGSELLCYERDRKGFPLCQRTLWRLQVPTVKRYDVRTNDISRFTAKNDLIVCGNRDGCVAIYSVANIRRRPELLCHLTDCHRGGLAEVSAVELSCRSGKLHVATGSDCAKNLYIWSVRPGSKAYCELDISIGDNVGVRSLSMDSAGERLAVGLNGNNMPIMVYMATGQVSLSSDATRSLKQVVRDIQWHDEHTLAFVTHYGSIKMLDVRSGNVVYRAADPFQSSLYCIRTDGRHAVVVGAAEYSRCVLFDARRASRHVQIYFTQKVSSPIYSLDFDCTKLVAAADRSAAILNFNVSDSNATLRDYSQTFEVINTVPYYDFDNADLPLVVP